MSILGKVSEMIHPGSSSFKDLILGATNQFGGVSGLVDQFKERGLGGLAESWMQGKDLDKLTASHVDAVLGSETVKRLAAKAGLQPEIVSEQLGKLLPTVVHQLSRSGQLPEGLVTEEHLSTGVLDRVKGILKKSA